MTKSRHLIFALTMLLAGCSKPPPQTAAPTPVAEVSPPPVVRAEATPVPAEPTPEPVVTARVMKLEDEKPLSPPQLQRNYWLTKDQAERTEIIYQLGDTDTAEAVHVLMWLYQAETDVDLKQEVLDAADRVDEQIPAKLALLNVALAPGQPAEMHDTVIEILLGINDRRAILTWQLLFKDPDPDIRELAEQQIEDLQKLDTN